MGEGCNQPGLSPDQLKLNSCSPAQWKILDVRVLVGSNLRPMRRIHPQDFFGLGFLHAQVRSVVQAEEVGLCNAPARVLAIRVRLMPNLIPDLGAVASDNV